MRASLDTNAIIHFYQAGLQNILFTFFDEGVFIYEQIREVELEHHGQEVLSQIDADIVAGRIEVYTDQKLKELQVYKVFENNVNENRYLMGTVDENQTINDFNVINNSSSLKWSFKSQIIKFIKRFYKDPYRSEDRTWIKKFACDNNINVKLKLRLLSKLL